MLKNGDRKKEMCLFDFIPWRPVSLNFNNSTEKNRIFPNIWLFYVLNKYCARAFTDDFVTQIQLYIIYIA